MKLKYLTLKLLLAAFFIAANALTFAQGPPGGPPPGGTPPTQGGPPCWDPSCIPLDGGLSFLIVAGAALGAKKIHSHRKSRD